MGLLLLLIEKTKQNNCPIKAIFFVSLKPSELFILLNVMRMGYFFGGVAPFQCFGQLKLQQNSLHLHTEIKKEVKYSKITISDGEKSYNLLGRDNFSE